MVKTLYSLALVFALSACATKVATFCDAAKPIPPAIYYNESSPGVFDYVKTITDAGCQAEPGCSSALTDIRTILGDTDGTTDRLAAYNAVGARLCRWGGP